MNKKTNKNYVGTKDFFC